MSTKKIGAIAAALMILAVTAFPTGKSYAASGPGSASGATPHSGFVAIPLDGVTPNACTSPQGVGDTWCYGSSYAPDGTKTCYSNYTHPTKYHSTTAEIGSSAKKGYAQAGNTARATAYGGALDRCYAYWDVY